MRDLRFGQLFRGTKFKVSSVSIVRMEPRAIHLKAICGICGKVCQTQMHWRDWMRWNHLCIEGAVADFLLRLLEVPDYSRYVSMLCGQHHLRIVCGQSISVKRMQIFVREVGRLANSLRVQQSKSALKGGGRRS